MVQPVEQRRIAAERPAEGDKTVAVAAEQLLLQRAEPGEIEIEHDVRPTPIGDGVAGMRLLRVDDNQIAGADLHAPLAVDIGADAAGDGADGKEFVAVQAVAHLAAIRDGTGFDERQLRIAPELRRFSLIRFPFHCGGITVL